MPRLARLDAPGVSEYRRLEFERRRSLFFEGLKIDITSPEDLVISKLDEFVKSPEIVMPDLIRHPEHIEFTGFRLSPE
jgi:hypothetical protein